MKIARFYGVAFFLFLFLLKSGVWAYSAADYYGAGLQLYNAKNYAQAIQYFGAAIKLDPNNTAALQGRANSYYSLGQYQQALDDYQRVQALQPNPQLASMIQSLQAKVGTVGAGAAPPPVPSAGGSFSLGLALFQQQQYAQAVPLFQAATRENPGDANAFYYLGASQMQAGDMKDAAVALGISNKLKPNPSVAGYVDQLKARLSPDDQQWVDSQISAGDAGAATGAAGPSKPKTFGIRLEPAMFMASLKDFDADAERKSLG